MEVALSWGEALRPIALGIHRRVRQIPQASQEGLHQKQLPHRAKAQAVMLGLFAEVQSRLMGGPGLCTGGGSITEEEAADPEKV